MPKTKKVKVKKSEDKPVKDSKKIPIGVRIISILYYVMAGLLVISGLFIILFSGIIVSTMISIDPNLSSVVNSQVIIWVGIFLILLGVLIFFVGRGLWKLKLWAKITALMISALMIVYEIYLMAFDFRFIQVIQLLIYVAIAVYLIVNKEAKKAFN
jgi:uncharacterized membrane protein (DUF2068 family)